MRTNSSMSHNSSRFAVRPVGSRLRRGSALGVIIALLAPLHGCGLLPGENEPLRALYFEDPALGLPPINVKVVSDGGASDTGTSPSPTTLDAGRTTATEPNTSESEPNKTSTASSEEPTSSATSSGNNCPAEANGLVLGGECSVGVGACRRVRLVECVDSELRCPAVELAPAAEVCNGADDDCDGEVDNLPGKCTVAEDGGKHPGVWSCANGERVCDFDPDVTVQEVCNGEDDDYNGLVDEGLLLEYGCSAGVGGCERLGDQVCVDGEYTCDAVADLPRAEQCNGIDDDCDGEVDEQLTLPGTCTAMVATCELAGRYECVAGQVTCVAVAIPEGPEYCNGIDDDCDGEIDDVAVRPCARGLGACQTTGWTRCYQGATYCTLESTIEPQDETCNGIDDDCDGEIDNGDACPTLDGGQ